MGEPGAPRDQAAERQGDRDATPLSTVVRVRSLLPSLPPAERRVAQRVIDDPEAVANSTITELAQTLPAPPRPRSSGSAGRSASPATRSCGSRLAAEAGRAPRRRRRPARHPAATSARPTTSPLVVKTIAFADARAVEDTAAQLDLEILAQVDRRRRRRRPGRHLRRRRQRVRRPRLPDEAAPRRAGRAPPGPTCTSRSPAPRCSTSATSRSASRTPAPPSTPSTRCRGRPAAAPRPSRSPTSPSRRYPESPT